MDDKEAERVLKQFIIHEKIVEHNLTYFNSLDYLTRKDIPQNKDNSKILRNMNVDENNNMIVEKSNWI